MITVEQNPASGGITPAFNECAFVVNSTNSGAANHKYIAVIKDDAGTEIQRLDFVAPPSYSNGYIDVSRIVSNYVTYDLDFTLKQVDRMLSSVAEFEIEFGEAYGDPVVEYLNQTTTTFYVSNMGLSTYNYLTYNKNDYVSTFLNKENTKLRIDSDNWLYFWHENTASVTGIRVTANNGTTDTITEIVNTHTAFTDWEDGFCYLPAGKNLNDILVGNLTIPTQGNVGNILPADTLTLKFELLDGVTVLDTHTYNIVGTCYGTYELYYLTDLGAFETLILPKAFKKQNAVVRETASRLISAMDSTTSYGYNSYSGQKVDRLINFRQQWKLNTDWISEAESLAYLKLIVSPVIFLNDNGTIKRVTTNQNAPMQKTERTDKLFNFSIDVFESQNQESQWVN